jgi:hypothetical protein
LNNIKHKKNTNYQYKKNPKSKMTNQALEKLTSVLFDGKNYNMWARETLFELIGIDKLEYVTDEITKPTPKIARAPIEEKNKVIRQWKKNDNRVLRWLLATMEPHIFKIMTYQYTTRQMWEKVIKLFGKRKNNSHVYRLQQ